MSPKIATEIDWLDLYNQQSWLEIKNSYENIASTDIQAVDPNSAFFYIISLFHLGLYADAVSASRSSYSLLKHLPEFFATWGAAARRKGDLEASKEIFQEAIQLFPNDTLLANNYANLLIDNGNFPEARDLLNKALSNKPVNEADILSNLNRLKLLEEEALSSPPQHVSLNGSEYELSVAIDPLLYAFSKAEVDHHAEKDSAKSKVKPNFSSQEIQERITLARSLAQSNPSAALKDIQAIYLLVGTNPVLYSIASDAYISLKSYKDAEICALTAIALGSTDSSLFINLSNFAHMRNEFRLASSYLDLASKSGADKSVIKSVKERQGTPDLSLDRVAPFYSDASSSV